MADEFQFPMRLRFAMERAATVLNNCADVRHREFDTDSQGLVRGVLDELDAACIEANLAVRPPTAPVAEVYGTTKSFGEGDEERCYEGTAVRLHREVPKGTKLYDQPGPNVTALARSAANVVPVRESVANNAAFKALARRFFFDDTVQAALVELIDSVAATPAPVPTPGA